MRKLTILLVATLLTFASMPADAKTRVAEFKGSGNMTTAIFRVESPWILDWRLDGDFEAMMGLEITLIEAKTSRHVGRVLYTKHRGNGVKLFHSAGLYQLRISSTLARWSVKIDQLTREEAELYTSKEKK
ncbi:MAG: hypothetical protein OES59_00620 [Gammaproteobacteria bacterium]|jgi:hypothetical protein|nr:hypothetical protein [Gammaproteobacteria bacterium]MDH3860414.1 hypothetical protein [Gammaproteobacteria bacterium]